MTVAKVSTAEKLGQRLVKAKIITEKQLADALEVHRAAGQPIGKVLIDLGYASQGQILAVLAQQMKIPYIDFETQKVNPNAITAAPEELARRYTVIPVDIEEDKLLVAMADPRNVLAIDDLRIVTGYEIKVAIATREDILAAIDEYYKEHVEEDLTTIDSGEDLDQLQEISEDAPIVKLVNLIVTRAVNDRASDIHIEPQEKDMRVRYRIDGVLHEVMRSPKQIQAAVLSRLKIMASMDIAETRKPQDGHCGLSVSGRAVDFRVATLPTVYGERVVLRILEKESIMLNLDDLGFLPDSLSKFKSAYTQPYGAILVTGPTGSGKSTTLYATLNVLNTQAKNIVTIEDPVEYRLPGINQVQINSRAGLTFGRGLRAILRTSPDIVMVGEIRDHETASIAVEAALTGHLVLSTLHTNDAPGAIARLTEMGIEPFLISSAIDCVQAQRLARRLCKGCKEAYKPSRQSLLDIDFPLDGDEIPTFYRPKGCAKCNGTGYKGRCGIYEVMVMSEQLERLTVARASAEEIKKAAIQEGMQTLRDDGLAKVKLGTTSIEEVMRVVV